MDGRLLGSGGTADVYEYHGNKVLKLYQDRYAKDIVEWEYIKTKAAYDYGLPAPRVYEVIQCNGRYGLVMDRIFGHSLFEVLAAQITGPGLGGESSIENSLFVDSIKKTAHLLNQLHNMSVHVTDTAESALRRGVIGTNLLTESEKRSVLDIISSLPQGASVCHGDPNPFNIIDTGSSYMLIDWVNCVQGSVLYDIAEYVLMFKYIEFHKNTYPEIVKYVVQYKNFFIDIFLFEYKILSKDDLSTLELWTIPMLASKLSGSGDQTYLSMALEEVRRLLRQL